MQRIKSYKKGLWVVTGFLLVLAFVLSINTHQAQAAEESGSVGLEGRISAPPPSTGASISFPTNGSTSNSATVTVSGLCPNGTIVKIFRNGVFAGAVPCTNGSYSIQIDLFYGRNEIVARVYDDLDQAGPDSNMVVVNFPFPGGGILNRISLTSSFAKRGANPKETLTWPITITGGTGPYAISVDWGDGKTLDLISQGFGGTFDISHIYDSPGVYIITIRATDANGETAFLQLIGVSNGPVGQSAGGGEEDKDSAITKTKILWQPAAIAIPLIATSFWLGRRYELHVLRKKLETPDN